MSGKLDQSLDEILSTQRRNAGRRRGPARRASAGNKAPTAPAGGIQKKTQPARSASKPTPKKGSGVTGESKIVVSNLVSHAPKSLHQTSEPTADFRDSPRTFPKARLRYVTTDEAIIAFGLLSTFLSVAFPIDVVSSVGIKNGYSCNFARACQDAWLLLPVRHAQPCLQSRRGSRAVPCRTQRFSSLWLPGKRL